MRTTSITRVLVVLLLFASTKVAEAQGRKVTGAWRRIALFDSSGKSTQPPSAPAFVVFTSDGYFSQTAIPAGRPKNNKPVPSMTKEELVANFQNVDAWRGTYTVAGNKLTRKDVADVHTSDEGGTLVQVMRFHGDTLFLTRQNPANKAEGRFVRVR
jgi:hypothetical protein